MNTEKVLIGKDMLHKRIKQLAKQIEEDYKGKDLMVIGILKGSVYFLTDLTREINHDIDLEFMRAASYEGEKSTGKVEIKIDLDESVSIEGKNILIVEDIVDTGNTLSFLVNYLKQKNPETVKTCVLLDKPDRREVTFQPDYTGFVIPNRFVIGYGLDLDEKYRNIPKIKCICDENDKDFEEDKKLIKKMVKANKKTS